MSWDRDKTSHQRSLLNIYENKYQFSRNGKVHDIGTNRLHHQSLICRSSSSRNINRSGLLHGMLVSAIVHLRASVSLGLEDDRLQDLRHHVIHFFCELRENVNLRIFDCKGVAVTSSHASRLPSGNASLTVAYEKRLDAVDSGDDGRIVPLPLLQCAHQIRCVIEDAEWYQWRRPALLKKRSMGFHRRPRGR